MIHHIEGPAGRLEALLDEPGPCASTGVARNEEEARRPSPVRARAVVVLAHPHPLHGGSMHTKLVFRVAKAFCGLGCAVLRFNFRGVGTSQGSFDDGPGEMDDFRKAVDHVLVRYPGSDVWACGVSFGAWVAMNVGATDDRVSRLVGIATPAARYDFSAVRTSSKPKFLVHGEVDEVAPLSDARRFYASAAEPKELVVIEMADHLFDGRIAEVVDAIDGLLGGQDGP
ncbi:MAG: alpha/beta hydrolase [Vicinamibacterales bacterium]